MWISPYSVQAPISPTADSYYRVYEHSQHLGGAGCWGEGGNRNSDQSSPARWDNNEPCGFVRVTKIIHSKCLPCKESQTKQLLSRVLSQQKKGQKKRMSSIREALSSGLRFSRTRDFSVLPGICRPGSHRIRPFRTQCSQARISLVHT